MGDERVDVGNLGRRCGEGRREGVAEPRVELVVGREPLGVGARLERSLGAVVRLAVLPLLVVAIVELVVTVNDFPYLFGPLSQLLRPPVDDDMLVLGALEELGYHRSSAGEIFQVRQLHSEVRQGVLFHERGHREEVDCVR